MVLRSTPPNFQLSEIDQIVSKYYRTIRAVDVITVTVGYFSLFFLYLFIYFIYFHT